MVVVDKEKVEPWKLIFEKLVPVGNKADGSNSQGWFGAGGFGARGSAGVAGETSKSNTGIRFKVNPNKFH